MKTYVTSDGKVVNQQVNATIQEAFDGSRDEKQPVAYIKTSGGVFGNKSGEIKTGDSNKKGGIATGSSTRRGLKSSYKSYAVTIPFFLQYLSANIEVIALIVASIQNKLSKILRDMQGTVDGSLKKKLRETAKRTEAISRAKNELMDRTTEQFDQKVFDKANADVRAKVWYDMHMTASVETTFSVPIENEEEAKWARDKGYVLDKTGSFYTMYGTEKGLKTVYLISADQIKRAQEKTEEITRKLEAILPEVKKLSTIGEDNSMKILNLVNEALDYPEQTVDEVDMDEYSTEELEEIQKWQDDIIFKYDQIRNGI